MFHVAPSHPFAGIENAPVMLNATAGKNGSATPATKRAFGTKIDLNAENNGRTQIGKPFVEANKPAQKPARRALGDISNRAQAPKSIGGAPTGKVSMGSSGGSGTARKPASVRPRAPEAVVAAPATTASECVSSPSHRLPSPERAAGRLSHEEDALLGLDRLDLGLGLGADDDDAECGGVTTATSGIGAPRCSSTRPVANHAGENDARDDDAWLASVAASVIVRADATTRGGAGRDVVVSGTLESTLDDLETIDTQLDLNLTDLLEMDDAMPVATTTTTMTTSGAEGGTSAAFIDDASSPGGGGEFEIDMQGVDDFLCDSGEDESY